MRGLDSPWGLRVTGLVGVAVVAAGAYEAGALPGRDPGLGLRGPGTPGAGFWWGLAAWVVGLAIVSGAWWRIGSRLGGLGSRWLITTGALWALPLLLAPPLASRDVYSYACQGEIWRSGLDPYAIGAADGGCLWSNAVPDLWQHTPAPYGPVGIALSGAAAAVARAVGGPADHRLLVAVTVLRLVALVGGVLIAVYAGRLANAVGVRPESARWLGLLSPLVAVHLVSGAHNDALTAGLLVAALAVAVPAVASRGPATVVLATPARDVPAAVSGPATTRSNDPGRETGEQSPHAARVSTGDAVTPGSVSRHGALAAETRSRFGPAIEAGSPTDIETETGYPAGTSNATWSGEPTGTSNATWTSNPTETSHATWNGEPTGTSNATWTSNPTETSDATWNGKPVRAPSQAYRGMSWGSAVGAGAFLGLAVGVKVTAILALPFVVLLVAGWRLRRGTPPWVTIALAGLTVTGTGALVFAAAGLATGLDLGWVGALSDTGSLVQWTSLPTGIGMAIGYVFRAAGHPGAVDATVDVARACGIAALAVIGLGLCWRALRATLALHPAYALPAPRRASTEADASPAPRQPGRPSAATSDVQPATSRVTSHTEHQPNTASADAQPATNRVASHTEHQPNATSAEAQPATNRLTSHTEHEPSGAAAQAQQETSRVTPDSEPHTSRVAAHSGPPTGRDPRDAELEPNDAATRGRAGTATRREVVAACGWALVAAAVLLPVFYPWYALVPLAVLACATPPGKTRTALATAAIVVTALALPNGLGLPVLTKLPGAIVDVAILVGGALAYFRFRNRRSNQDDPVPAAGSR
ncbi:hypothetical protein SAMN05421812_108177 [Asanoa hainanensis]|uniref:Alpha-1,6-mannosyltransferase n=1 Tax=Asanoa hainanensis TaxID=560556 RepID=A0A239NET9_9ACTN|nr:polyprenol phosphomannose-dependent alpha 1,6 mannosyltransferase MptB [Asanoa hainanensis]SNT52818.1 hypothetical protein SAMN05421812_108177 [Asanoa hainanensis]